MALVLNGTSQAAYLASAGLNPETEEWAIFAWVKRDSAETAGFVFGGSRSTSFKRLAGVSIRDVSGAVVSAHSNNGSDYYLGTTAITADTWTPVYRSRNAASGSPSDHTINAGGTATSGNLVSNTPFDRWVIGAAYTSAALDDFFAGKVCHFAIWKGSRPGSTSIAQLMSGIRPDLVDDAPDEYHALVSGLGSFTGVGTPTFDADDPLVSSPSINPTGTTTSAAPGGAFTVNLSNMDGRTVASLELYDPASGVSTAQSYTGTTSLTGTVTLGNLPYRSGMEWVVTLDNAAELTSEFEMVPAAGRSLTEIEADFDETDQSIGYGFDPALEVGSQLEYATDTLTVYPDALFYTDYEGSQVVNHWSPTEGEWYQETIITGDLPSEVNDMFKLPTMAIPAMKIPTMRIP